MEATTLAILKEIIVEVVGYHLLQSDKIKPESSFIDDLLMDSIDVIELIMGCESEFGIEIEKEDADNCKTVQNLVEIIERLKAKR